MTFQWWHDLIFNSPGYFFRSLAEPTVGCISTLIGLFIALRANWKEFHAGFAAHRLASIVGGIVGGAVCAGLACVILLFFLWSPLFPLGGITGLVVGAFGGAFLGMKIGAKVKLL